MQKENLGPRLKAERIRKGMTQDEVARLGGVGKNAQVNYERSVDEKLRRAPDADYLAQLARAGFDIHFLMTGERLADQTETPEALRSLFDAWLQLWAGKHVDAETIDLFTKLAKKMMPA